MHDVTSKSGAFLVWMDMSKLGKVSGKELACFADVLSGIMRTRPTQIVGFVVCPILVSDKVGCGLRDELRRFEDKFDAKRLSNHLITLRMELPPSQKKAALIYHAWVVLDADTEPDNLFAGSQLIADRWGDFGNMGCQVNSSALILQVIHDFSHAIQTHRNIQHEPRDPKRLFWTRPFLFLKSF